MSVRQIDWRSDISAIQPFLDSRNGVVHVEFESEDCASNQFSSLLKQIFSEFGDNRFSIRIDHNFATTHVTHDILTEFETQLKKLGIKLETPDLPRTINVLTDMEAGDNIGVSVGSISVSSDPHSAILEQRREVICAALNEFIASGGRFMIEHRDAPKSWQSTFLKQIWAPILSKFIDNGLLYVQMLGPECRQTAHEDALTPQLTRRLPTGFETDERRENDAYDDLIDVFEAEGYNREAAVAAASTHLENNLKSVSKMHNKLTGVLLSIKQRQTR